MGDKICLWFESSLPGLTRWIGGMSEWEAVAFAFGLMALGYLIYAAAWNVWLCGVEAWGSALSVSFADSSARGTANARPKGRAKGYADAEPYEPWMDREKWRDE